MVERCLIDDAAVTVVGLDVPLVEGFLEDDAALRVDLGPPVAKRCFEGPPMVDLVAIALLYVL